MRREDEEKCVSSYWETLRQGDDIEIERGSTRSHKKAELD